MHRASSVQGGTHHLTRIVSPSYTFRESSSNSKENEAKLGITLKGIFKTKRDPKQSVQLITNVSSLRAPEIR
jgi:hypothetical protein